MISRMRHVAGSPEPRGPRGRPRRRGLVLELAGREVDRHRLRRPIAQLAAASAAWPRRLWRRMVVPIGMMSPVSSASGMNSSGGDHAPLRMVPAGERLHADDLVGRQVDDRLVVRLELASATAATEVRLQAHPLDDGGVHAGLVDLEAALALALGPVHGEVGVAEQAGRVLLAVADDDADAGVDGDERAVDLDRGAHELEDRERPPRRPRLDRGGARAAPRTRRRRVVTRCRRVGSPSPIRSAVASQDLVAGLVTEAVVHGLEVVEVEVDQRQPIATAPAGRLQGVLDAVEEQGSVGERGQGVVERLVRELRPRGPCVR